MESKIIAGRIGKLPAYGAVTNLNSADITQIIGATTGLVKTLGKYALVGGLATLGVGAIFLSLLLASMVPAAEPTIPLGCTPNFIKTPKRSFWGILLDDDLEFESEGQTLKVPFDFVRSFNARGFFGQHEMVVELVDGSCFRQTRLIAPVEFSLTTLAGVQKIPFQLNSKYKNLPYPVYAEKVEFRSPTVAEVSRLRNGLQTALDQNSAAITQLIGPNVLQTFFNVQSI